MIFRKTVTFVKLVSSYANRGNVAIIVWNTLEAPAVWDVTGTEYSDGTINLSNSRASLLSIYFRNYVNENGELIHEIEKKVTEIVKKSLLKPYNYLDLKNQIILELNLFISEILALFIMSVCFYFILRKCKSS